MKKVIRYKCDYCTKLYAKPETMERHEPECIKNPDGINCLLCAFCYIGDWEYDEYHNSEDVPICIIREEACRELKDIPAARGHKSYAPMCEDFKRRSDGGVYHHNKNTSYKVAKTALEEKEQNDDKRQL